MTICNVCQALRPRARSNEKGRILRPRAANGVVSRRASPTAVTLISDHNTVAGSSSTEEEEDDQDFVVSLSTKKGRSNRGGRGRGRRHGGEPSGKGGRANAAARATTIGPTAGSSNLRRVVGDARSATGASPTKDSSEFGSIPEASRSSAQQRTMEVDVEDSDSRSSCEMEFLSAGEEEDSSGETPPLFGRGWGDKRRANSAARSRAATRKAGMGRGAASSTLCGQKRNRPLPSPPPIFSDNIFSSGVHAAGGSESDEESTPLVPPCTRDGRFKSSTGGGRLRWRWPPPPAGLAPIRRATSSPTSATTHSEGERESGSATSEVIEERRLGNGDVSSSGGPKRYTLGESVNAVESEVEHGDERKREREGGGSGEQEAGLSSQDSSAVVELVPPVESPAESVVSMSQQQSQGRRAPKK